ncbi:hypothetical protein GBF38_010441, partial [Nibea albiflora]
LPGNQVSSNNKSNATATPLRRPPVVTQRSKRHIKQNNNQTTTHVPIVQHCCEKAGCCLVQSVGFALEQWKQPGQGSGRCECVVFESSIAEFGKRLKNRPDNNDPTDVGYFCCPLTMSAELKLKAACPPAARLPARLRPEHRSVWC